VNIMDPFVGDSVIHYVPEFEKRWNRRVRRVKASCRRSAAELVAILLVPVAMCRNRSRIESSRRWVHKWVHKRARSRSG
jgi:hypothetical protein